ncbi:hypothetical protein ABG067_003397 [Albugo candida]
MEDYMDFLSLERGYRNLLEAYLDELQALQEAVETFVGYDEICANYYLDVFGVGVEEERNNILRALHKLGCQVVYDTFRETIPTREVVMSTWRVYFGCLTCPQQLVRVVLRANTLKTELGTDPVCPLLLYSAVQHSAVCQKADYIVV